MNNLPKTNIISGEQAREAIKIAVNLLEQAVGSTLGARGKAVLIDKGYDTVIIRDGVSVARAINLEDKAQQAALSVMREAAQKTVDEVGDSTTATIILAHALYTEGIKRIAAGIDPRQFVLEMESDIAIATKLIEEKAIPVTNLKQKIQIATISSEEESLGKLIGETIDTVGNDGVVTVDKSKSGETYVEMQEGMQWDRGLASPYFITDPESLTATVENGAVFVTDFALTSMKDVLPLIQDIVDSHGVRFFTFIAPEFGGDVLPSLIANKAQGKFLGICVKAPSFGGQQTNMLQDIAILTGATFISESLGHKLSDVRFTHLGKAERISASQTTALIAGGLGDKEAITSRIAEIKKLLEDETSDFEIERLKERLAKLTNGVAVIRVGGKTDVEMKERFERALDATLATRQAVKKGIVPGGEVVYLSLIKDMKSDIVKRALTAPFRRLMSNAGYDGGEMLAKLGSRGDDTGFNVVTGEFGSMIKSGIIDPASCSVSALNNAFSVASSLLITETLIIPIEEKK